MKKEKTIFKTLRIPKSLLKRIKAAANKKKESVHKHIISVLDVWHE